MTQNNETTTKKKTPLQTLKDNAVFTIMLILIIAFFCVFFFNTVDGESMTNTYQDKQLCLCMRTKNVTHGDVIICDIEMVQQDQTIKKRLVKRVIAVGGDTIDIKDGKVYLNGEQLDEPYIREPMIYVPEQSQEYPLTVPEGKFFVMGDNRNFSNDSRDTRYGLVDAENVLGKIVFPKK